MAKVKIQAYVFAQELTQHYSSVALFKLTSIGELTVDQTNGDIEFDNPKIIDINTDLLPKNPQISYGKCHEEIYECHGLHTFVSYLISVPGQGVQCGELTCNKYADCNYELMDQTFKCRCVPGFEGDGVESCDRSTSM